MILQKPKAMGHSAEKMRERGVHKEERYQYGWKEGRGAPWLGILSGLRRTRLGRQALNDGVAVTGVG